jgi:SAM-dependent methyltransferase
LETIRENLKNDRLYFAIGSATALPFPDNTFDTVVSWEVIEHIPKNQELKMFSEINRVLKPEGKLYLSTPNRNFFANIFDPAWWLIGHRHYSIKDLLDYAEKDSFKMEKKSVRGGWWTLLGILNLYFSKWVLRRKRIAEKFCLKKEDEEFKKEDGFENIFIKFKKI